MYKVCSPYLHLESRQGQKQTQLFFKLNNNYTNGQGFSALLEISYEMRNVNPYTCVVLYAIYLVPQWW